MKTSQAKTQQDARTVAGRLPVCDSAIGANFRSPGAVRTFALWLQLDGSN